MLFLLLLLVDLFDQLETAEIVHVVHYLFVDLTQLAKEQTRLRLSWSQF